MDSRHIEEFLVLAETLNYTLAAHRVHVARPTLVEHMAELEGELECPLFCKADGRLSLTPVGRRFVRSASTLLDSVRSVVAEYRSLRGNFLSVRIASTNLPWLESRLHRARRILEDAHPEKTVEVVSVPGAASTVEALFDGSNDIVISGRKNWGDDSDAPEPPRKAAGFKLQTEPIMLLMTRGNPLFDVSAPHACDLDGALVLLPPDIYAGYIRDGVVERFAEFGAKVTLRPLSLGDHFEYFMHDFADAFGVVPTTLLPRFGIDKREECRAFELSDLKLRTDFFVMYREDFLEDETARVFIDALKRAVRENDSCSQEETHGKECDEEGVC